MPLNGLQDSVQFWRSVEVTIDSKLSCFVQQSRVLLGQSKQRLLHGKAITIWKVCEIAIALDVEATDSIEERFVVIPITHLWGWWRRVEGYMTLVVRVDNKRTVGIKPDLVCALADR